MKTKNDYKLLQNGLATACSFLIFILTTVVSRASGYIQVDGYSTTSGGSIIYACQGSSVTLTAVSDPGDTDPPPNPCCDEDGNETAWTVEDSSQTTYSWGVNAISSTSATTTLDTSTVRDNEYATCEVTYKWQCSATDDEATTKETIYMSYPTYVNIKKNDDGACDPEVPADSGTVTIPDCDFSDSTSETTTCTPPFDIAKNFYDLSGKLTNVKGHYHFTKSGGRETGPACGLAWQRATTGSPEWSITGVSVGAEIPGTPFFACADISFGDQLDITNVYNADAHPFWQRYGQLYTESVQLTSAKFGSGTTLTKTNGCHGDKTSWDLSGGNADVSAISSDSQYGDVGFTCHLDCCPTFEQNQ